MESKRHKMGIKVDGKFMLCAIEGVVEANGSDVSNYSVSEDKEGSTFQTLPSPVDKADDKLGEGLEDAVIGGAYRSKHAVSFLPSANNLERSIPDGPVTARERSKWDRKLQWVSDYRGNMEVVESEAKDSWLAEEKEETK